MPQAKVDIYEFYMALKAWYFIHYFVPNNTIHKIERYQSGLNSGITTSAYDPECYTFRTPTLFVRRFHPFM